MKKVNSSCYASVLILALALQACATETESTDTPSRDMKVLANDVSEGALDQDDLAYLNLSTEEQREFARAFSQIRDWNLTDEDLDQAVHVLFQRPGENSVDSDGTAQNVTGNQQNFGACAQVVEQANGSTGSSYVAGVQTPGQNECGGDPDDRILVFNLYWGGTDPDNARYWSGLWWVRSTLSSCYSSGLSTNGLCSSTAHTCMGSCGLWLGNDLYSIYLWHL